MSKAQAPETPTFDFNDPALLRQMALLDLSEEARGDGLEGLKAFGQCVFGVKMPPHVEGWMTEILGNKRVGITAPPESAKTTWMIILVCWWIGRHPWQMNLVISEASTGALKIASKIVHTIEHSERWKLVFPNVVPDPSIGWSREGWTVIDKACAPDKWAKLTATRANPTLAYGGVGSSDVNGRRVDGILLCDDIHGFASKSSDTICQETVAFVQSTVLSRAKTGAHVVFVQTRWNAKDVIAYIKTLAHFKVFEHPALIRDEDGERSYWPAQWPLERLQAKLEEVGSIMFELVYQGNDKATVGSTLKGEWLLPFPALLFKAYHPRYFGVDFAIKTESLVGSKTRDPDRFVVAVLAHTGDLLAVEDGFAGRVSQAEAEEKLWQMNDIYHPKMIYLETNAAGEVFYQTLVRRMLAEGKRLPLIGQKAVKNKGERIMEMQPDFEFGRVRVSDAATNFLNLFRDEWLGFGQKRSHDDTLDAVYWAWRAANHLIPAVPLTEQRERARIVSPWKSLVEQHV